MRYDKTRKILELARALASSAEGLTLDEMCRATGCERRTVERMRDTIRDVFPQMEEIPDHPTKRFHIPKGLDGFFQDPTAEELSDLGVVIAELRDDGRDGARRIACGSWRQENPRGDASWAAARRRKPTWKRCCGRNSSPCKPDRGRRKTRPCW